ncbi:MAG: bifunctional phosphoglucose/phosphomannose isomerase [bacterium]
MIDLVNQYPQMLKDGYFLEGIISISISKKGNIYFAGMGGSAISGDIAAAVYESELNAPIYVIRDYHLPKYVDEDALVVIVSYSGNTEETLSCLDDAIKIGAKIVTISSDGALEKKAKDNKIPFIKVAAGLPPRAALGYLLGALLKILNNSDVIKTGEKEIKNVSTFLSSKQEEYKHRSKDISEKIQNKLPLIFASPGLTYAAGLRLKTQFNENSKLTAHLSIFPELSHNEIVNIGEYTKVDNPFSVILLRDQDESGKMKKRIDITKDVLSSHIEIQEIWSEGDSKLERCLSLVHLGDYISVYTAELRNVDPIPVTIIEEFKREMEQ